MDFQLDGHGRGRYVPGDLCRVAPFDCALLYGPEAGETITQQVQAKDQVGHNTRISVAESGQGTS
jgi:hypothetical protein